MRMIRDRTGRFRERPFYENTELDADCERLVCDFLRRTHGDVGWPLSTDNLTKLVEENVEDLDLYADLSGMGGKVEGVTHFFRDRPPRVQISRDLSENPRNANRLRTTLTHELGHVRFHGFLFQLGKSEFGDLFSAGMHVHGGPAAAPGQSCQSQQCRRETIVDAREVDWLEWQAGYACGAFLMPISALRAVVRTFVSEHRLQQAVMIDTSQAQCLIEAVAGRFAVSEDAARTRLLKLKFLVPADSADTLFS